MKKIGFAIILVVSLIFLLAGSAIASPYVVGYVNDSFSGISADDNIITLWNPTNGINDNLTDIIGSNGNSGANNFFMIDCELLNTPCDVGNVISIKVFSAGDNPSTQIVNVTISGSGFDVAPNLMINSRPNVSAINPIDYANISGLLTFNCSSFDPDGNLANVSLYANFSNNYVLNETKTATGINNVTIFTKSPGDGRYQWSCLAFDNLGLYNFSNNRTVTSDITPPSIYSISLNQTLVCGLNTSVRVSCNTSDSLSYVHNVLIRAVSNTSSINYSAIFSGGLYYADVSLNQYGQWNFTCISNDSASNLNYSNYSFNGIITNAPNLRINSSTIIFSKNNPIEDEQITINVSVENNGCVDANNLLVGFYEGNSNISGIQIGQNISRNVSTSNSTVFSINWFSKIGFTNIFVFADVNNSFNETTESDNIANKSISVISWHVFYGNVTADRILANSRLYNLSLWLNDTNSSGNVYVSDTESQLNWASLIAFGRNKTNSATSNDFSEIDSTLGSNNYLDSVSNTFTTDGNIPRNTSTFLVSNHIVQNVPTLNTSSNYNFVTGILWDSFDDTNGEYDSSEREDIVFVSKINRNSAGSYGNYDYEIRVPSKLREYESFDTSEVFIYFDLS